MKESKERLWKRYRIDRSQAAFGRYRRAGNDYIRIGRMEQVRYEKT